MRTGRGGIRTSPRCMVIPSSSGCTPRICRGPRPDPSSIVPPRRPSNRRPTSHGNEPSSKEAPMRRGIRFPLLAALAALTLLATIAEAKRVIFLTADTDVTWQEGYYRQNAQPGDVFVREADG